LAKAAAPDTRADCNLTTWCAPQV